MKIIILDGVDNSGKTSAAKALYKILDAGLFQASSIHFPSEEICDSKLFYDLLNKPTKQIKRRFIRLLLKEEYNALKSEIDKGTDILIIDRFLISSLMYQGSEPETVEMIMDGYEEMLKSLKIKGTDIHHFVFPDEVCDDGKEENEVKRHFDARSRYMSVELRKMIENMRASTVKAVYLNDDNVSVFNDALKAIVAPYPSQEQLDTLTSNRCDVMLKWVGGEMLIDMKRHYDLDATKIVEEYHTGEVAK